MKKSERRNYLTKLEIILKYKKIQQNKHARTSTIYKYNEEFLLKVFKYEKQEEIDKYKLFCSLDINNFAMPKELIYILGKFYGYIMNFKPGDILENININTLLSELIYSINNIEKGIYTISKNKIVISDLHDQNILYDDKSKELNIIDIDEYYLLKKKGVSIEELYLNNLNKLYSMLFDFIADCPMRNYLYNSFTDKDKNIEKYDGKELFQNLINELENRFNTEILTINDFRCNIKKLI